VAAVIVDALLSRERRYAPTRGAPPTVLLVYASNIVEHGRGSLQPRFPRQVGDETTNDGTTASG